MSDPNETPWAIVQRMRGQGAGLGPIVAALQAKGVSREDIEVLLDGAPELTQSRDAANAQMARIKRNPPDVLMPVDFSEVLPWSGAVAAMVMGVCGAAIGGAGGWAAVAAGVAITAAVVVRRLRKSVQRTLRALGGSVLGVMLVPIFSASQHGFGPYQLAAVGLALAGVGLLGYSYSRRDPMKGVRDFRDGLTVYEDNDVQFVIKLPARPTVGPGELFDVVVIAQCCVDCPRELLVEIDADALSVEGERTHRFPLQPGVVVELRIPVRVGPLAPKFADLIVVVSSLGLGGNRVQHSSGSDWVRPKRTVLDRISVGLELVMTQQLDLDQFSSDGHVRLLVDTSRPVATAERPVQQRTLFTPTSEELAKAAKA